MDKSDKNKEKFFAYLDLYPIYIPKKDHDEKEDNCFIYLERLPLVIPVNELDERIGEEIEEKIDQKIDENETEEMDENEVEEDEKEKEDEVAKEIQSLAKSRFYAGKVIHFLKDLKTGQIVDKEEEKNIYSKYMTGSGHNYSCTLCKEIVNLLIRKKFIMLETIYNHFSLELIVP